MDVKSELIDAQLEIIGEDGTILFDKEESNADFITGKVYFNGDTKEIIVGDGAAFARFKSNSQHAVGDVKTSMLTELQFQVEVDDPTWVLADGRDLDLDPETIDSQYKTVTGSAIIPDLRGVFLRGKNNGRSTATGNPTDVPLGTHQSDHNKAHTHSYTAAFTNSQADGGTAVVIVSTGTGSNTGGDSSGGGAETRVRSVTINHFIKVNR
jgi:hypothetical protein